MNRYRSLAEELFCWNPLEMLRESLSGIQEKITVVPTQQPEVGEFPVTRIGYLKFSTARVAFMNSIAEGERVRFLRKIKP